MGASLKRKAANVICGAALIGTLGLEGIVSKARASLKESINLMCDIPIAGPATSWADILIWYYRMPNHEADFVTTLTSACDQLHCYASLPPLDKSHVWEMFVKAGWNNGLLSGISNIVTYTPATPPGHNGGPPNSDNGGPEGAQTFTVDKYPLATRQNQLVVSGTFLTEGALYVNKEMVPVVNGKWSHPVNLNAGKNKLWMEAVATSGNRWNHDGVVVCDQKKPKITSDGAYALADAEEATQLVLRTRIESASHLLTSVYVNDKLSYRMQEPPANERTELDKSALENFVNGKNKIRFETVDLVGNKTYYEEILNLVLGFDAIEGADKYKNNAELLKHWKSQNNGGLEARLTVNPGVVTDGVFAIELPLAFNLYPETEASWKLKLDEKLNLDDYSELNADVYNPFEDEVKLKIEFDDKRHPDRQILYTQELKHGKNRIKINTDELNTKGIVADEIEFSFANEDPYNLIKIDQRKHSFCLDRMYGVPKIFIDDAEEDFDRLNGKWKSLSGLAEPLIERKKELVSEGNQSLLFDYEGIVLPPDKSLQWEYKIEPQAVRLFSGFGYDIYNPRRTKDLSAFMQLKLSNGTILSDSTSLEAGMTKLRYKGDLAKNFLIDPELKIESIIVGITNAGRQTIIPQAGEGYFSADGIFLEPSFFTIIEDK